MLRATLRLQFHQGFTLDDAVPLYLILRAWVSATSTHHRYSRPAPAPCTVTMW